MEKTFGFILCTIQAEGGNIVFLFQTLLQVLAGCLTRGKKYMLKINVKYIYICRIFFFLLYLPRIAVADCRHKLCKLYLL